MQVRRLEREEEAGSGKDRVQGHARTMGREYSEKNKVLSLYGELK